MSDHKIPIIVDTDANNELDDQHALAYMFSHGDVFDVVGLTVNKTRGGGSIEDHHQEAVRITQLYDLESAFPIHKGATGSFNHIINTLDQDDHDGHAAIDFIIEQAHQPREQALVVLAIGKLTNPALAIQKDPSIIPKIRLIWLGPHYPEPRGYNLVSDPTALNPVLDSAVAFEMVAVRRHDDTGCAAVVATFKDIQATMPGLGPRQAEAVIGRDGLPYHCFGDYSVTLFENFKGGVEEWPLFDVVPLAVLKKPSWGQATVMPAPLSVGYRWRDRPDNPRKIILWEHFNKEAIINDFYQRMKDYVLVGREVNSEG